MNTYSQNGDSDKGSSEWYPSTYEIVKIILIIEGDKVDDELIHDRLYIELVIYKEENFMVTDIDDQMLQILGEKWDKDNC